MNENNEKLENFSDIRRVIGNTTYNGVTPSRILELGTCGMGMPVLESKMALDEMAPGEVLETHSGHP